MSPPRSVLLVGEGNFSFSAAVARFHSDSSITATCLQDQQGALQHDGAEDNVQIIRDSGGVVLFEVDCTRLGECAALQGLQFDQVVFNFPHCGRKSGVKKNRELLKNFFLSCVQVLAEDGEVHVSLCDGQGGTPADQPRRERHNSWQVVAMAAEARLLLNDVRPFDPEKYQNYKSTGYRSQDKGFHLEKALLHVFTLSLPFSPTQSRTVEEMIEGDRVQYDFPAELSEYTYRGFLSPDSVHPVRLVQEFLLEGLSEAWIVSMTTETLPYLLTAKMLQTSCCETADTQCYRIHALLQKDLSSQDQTSTDQHRDQCDGHTHAGNKDETGRSNGGKECVRPTYPLDVDPEGENAPFVLRPSLFPQMEELLSGEGEESSDGQEESKGRSISAEDVKEEPRGRCNGFAAVLRGMSGLVFRRTPISPWGLPAFHQILLTGVFPSEGESIGMLGRTLETLLAPYGVSLVAEEEGLCLTAQPMGTLGKIFSRSPSQNPGRSRVTASLNLDLLAALLFALPDWRLLWSRDPRFLKQFEPRPPPGKPFQPFSLFPETFTFDISFWTGLAWEETRFHAAVRAACCGTVTQIKLLDTFSHPDLNQTSYCYRLTYHSHTHALSHTQALLLHKDLETLLSSRFEVTIR